MKASIDNIPSHIGIIMDGNGRWAKKRGLPRPIGHKNGATTTRNIIDAADRLGVKYLTLYVFSAENWDRPPKEVKLLMKLLVEMIKKEIKSLKERNVRVIALGDLSKLPDSARNELELSIKETSHNTGLTLQLAISYGGRAEIIRAAKELAKLGKLEDITEDHFSKYLYTSNSPDPELIIRTGGDQRISNFLLWQSAYSELYFTDTLWPDFNEDGLIEALKEFNRRERRFGRVLDD
jgi:undecaprenyl diphosphate synthase